MSTFSWLLVPFSHGQSAWSPNSSARSSCVAETQEMTAKKRTAVNLIAVKRIDV